ncbi:hypothetical protein CROQUDRAFT_89010 [Cronartium quercuum f. sp. fusiforme G11]|uniref:Uncharacterized protein n=1 Tax=Cronartium quercuum f. sp. fusiforme G11 TaxID=708437 RepID=A0A9P6TES3_9BASI|nr:hypothetical protein CROQUDRAFT_89010 [Cronartium quercuum f. sp. fusiforme G11]
MIETVLLTSLYQPYFIHKSHAGFSLIRGFCRSVVIGDWGPDGVKVSSILVCKETYLTNFVKSLYDYSSVSIEARLDGEPIRVRGASVLPSGDVKLYVASRHIKTWLLHNKHLRSTLAHPELVTTQTCFPVLIHSVPTDNDPTSEDFITHFATDQRMRLLAQDSS